MDSELGIPLPRRTGSARGWRRVLRRRVPLLRWLPNYGRVAALADLVAGVTLGLTLVPQSIAYASLANLPVQYGLYSSFVGHQSQQREAYAMWGSLYEEGFRRYDAVRGAGHGEGGVHRSHQPHGAVHAADLPRPARGVRGAAHFPVGLRRAHHGPAAIRFPGGLDLPVGDERVHVGHSAHHRGGAAQGAAGAQLHGRVLRRQHPPHRHQVGRRAPGRRHARGRLLLRAAAAQEAEGRARALGPRGARAVAAVHQPQRARGAGRVVLRLPHAPPQPAALQTIRARGAGPAAPGVAALQRRAGQQHRDLRGHGAHAGLGRRHDAHRHGARQHRHRQGFLDRRASGCDARDGDPRAVQHGRFAGARHAHVWCLHALRRVALQRRAHARRRPLLRYHYTVGADLPHAVLLLYPEGVSLLRAHLCSHIYDRFAHRVPAVAARPAGAGGAGADVLRQHRAHRGAGRAGGRAGLAGRAAAPAHAARRARARAQDVGGRRGARARGPGPGLRVGRAAGAPRAGRGRARGAAPRAAGLPAPRAAGLRRREGAGTSYKEVQDGRAAADLVQRAGGAVAQVRAACGRGPAVPARAQRVRRAGQRGARRRRERHAAGAHGARRARRARCARSARVTALK